MNARLLNAEARNTCSTFHWKWTLEGDVNVALAFRLLPTEVFTANHLPPFNPAFPSLTPASLMSFFTTSTDLLFSYLGRSNLGLFYQLNHCSSSPCVLIISICFPAFIFKTSYMSCPSAKCHNGLKYNTDVCAGLLQSLCVFPIRKRFSCP